jgi:uncharacterized coiled-coil DUF342 family protein
MYTVVPVINQENTFIINDETAHVTFTNGVWTASFRKPSIHNHAMKQTEEFKNMYDEINDTINTIKSELSSTTIGGLSKTSETVRSFFPETFCEYSEKKVLITVRCTDLIGTIRNIIRVLEVEVEKNSKMNWLTSKVFKDTDRNKRKTYISIFEKILKTFEDCISKLKHSGALGIIKDIDYELEILYNYIETTLLRSNKLKHIIFSTKVISNDRISTNILAKILIKKLYEKIKHIRDMHIHCIIEKFDKITKDKDPNSTLL